MLQLTACNTDVTTHSLQHLYPIACNTDVYPRPQRQCYNTWFATLVVTRFATLMLQDDLQHWLQNKNCKTDVTTLTNPGQQD